MRKFAVRFIFRLFDISKFNDFNAGCLIGRPIWTALASQSPGLSPNATLSGHSLHYGEIQSTLGSGILPKR
jgi:hypothetical protein